MRLVSSGKTAFSLSHAGIFARRHQTPAEGHENLRTEGVASKNLLPQLQMHPHIRWSPSNLAVRIAQRNAILSTDAVRAW